MVNLYIINESSTGTIYGIGSSIRELTISLKNSDINVCVIHLRSEKPNMETEDRDRVRHWYIPPLIGKHTSINRNRQYELYYRNVVYILQLQIKEKKNLVFHLNHMHCKPLAESLKKAFDCKIVLTVHYLDSIMALMGNISKFRMILSQPDKLADDEIEKFTKESFLKEKELFGAVDKIICLSKHTFILLHQDYRIDKEKMMVIYNGLSDNCPVSNKSVLRQKYQFTDIPIMLFVGRLDNMKGLMHVIRAFKKIIAMKLNCRLIIAGNGDYDTFLKECDDIWTHVTWTGRIDKNKLYELYSIADIGIMPSLSEQCSYVAIEMMMHGLPIIGSTSTGLKEMIADRKTGFQIPVIEHDDNIEIDTDLLAEKMLLLLQNNTERKRMGRNARKRYKRLYTLDVMRGNILNFYTSL